jgi:hypothetical protein
MAQSKFTAKITRSLHETCVTACEFVNERSPQKDEARSAWSILAQVLNAAVVIDGRRPLHLDAYNSDLLQAALKVYLEDGDLRPGSEKYQEAESLMWALVDFVTTKIATDIPAEVQAMVDEDARIRAYLNKKKARADGEMTPDEFEAFVREKRDGVFREIVGTPATLSIWERY